MVVHQSAAGRTLHLLLMLVGTASELHPRRPDVALHLLGLQVRAKIVVGARVSRWIVVRGCSTAATGPTSIL